MTKQINFFYIIIFSIFLNSCSDNSIQNSKSKPEIVYLSFAGEKNDFKIWIVNGDKVRKNYFDEFLYGGNPQRYPFIPYDEIWIDNSISAEEFETTVAHEIKENLLMAKYGLLYTDAHDSALALEVKMRKEWEEICRVHEYNLDSVIPRDFDSTMEIVTLPEKIKLKNVYRIPLGKQDGLSVWVVDGYVVRRDIFPDFGFSGNDCEYFFIPEGEIWIDGQISCEETSYSVKFELKEREMLLAGKNYNDAYSYALSYANKVRTDDEITLSKKPEIKKTEPPFRDKGIGKQLQ